MTPVRLGLCASLVLALVACGQPSPPPNTTLENVPWSAGNEADTLSALSLQSGVNDLSGQTPVYASSGYGPYERNTSNGESAPGDGHPLTLNGVVYAKGLGVHAESRLVYNLRGSPTDCTFTSDVGVDDEVGSRGSVIFKVLLDGTVKYSSGTMTGSSATKSVKVDLSGAKRLALVVAGAGDGIDYDHADWAGAKITCGTVQTQPPGTLDRTSKLSADPSVEALAAALGTDGSVLTAGTRNGDFALVRSRPDGTTQTVTTDFGGNDKPEHVYVLPDGKIEVIGFIDAPGASGGLSRNPMQFVAARYLPDLSPDASFGTAGKVLGPVNTADSKFNTALVQPDGTFVLGGDAKGAFTPTFTPPGGSPTTGTNRDVAVERLLPNGTPDTMFGTAGLVTTDTFASSNDAWYDDRVVTLALQPDGSLLVGGFYTSGSFFATPTYPTQIVLRYGPGGALDPAFGQNGHVLGGTFRFVSTIDQINTQDPTSFITAYRGYGVGCGLQRYSGAGVPLETANPFVSPDISPGPTRIRTALQADGKVVAVGCDSAPNSPPTSQYLVRENADGSVDTGFGTNGLVKISKPVEVLLGPDGKIIVVSQTAINRYWP